MFVIDIQGNKERCFKLNENSLRVYDFNDVTVGNKLQFNKTVAGASVTNDIRALRAFYIGMATKVLSLIKLVPTVADDDINYTSAFRALFRNLGYCINENIISSFNIDLFVDECMNIYTLKISPLIYNTSINNSKIETHHYISGITSVYSAKELDDLNDFGNIFISGMANLTLKFK